MFDADYNQIEAQLLDVDSELYHFSPDTIVLWLATEKLYEEFLDMPLSNRAHFADIYIEKIRGYWELIEKNSKAKVIQMNFLLKAVHCSIQCGKATKNKKIQKSF